MPSDERGLLRLIVREILGNPTGPHQAFLMKGNGNELPDGLALAVPLEVTDIELMMAWLQRGPRATYIQLKNLPCDSKWKDHALFAYYAVCEDDGMFGELSQHLKANTHIAAASLRGVNFDRVRAAEVRALHIENV